MEIKRVNKTGLGRAATDLIKSNERVFNSSAVQFLEATPIECNYYSIDYDRSTVGIGFKDDAGPFSGARKYKFIKDYIMYGYNESKEMTPNEKDEENFSVELAEEMSLHLPGTINPKVGDLLTLHIQNNNLFYIITNVANTTFHNKPYIKTEYVLVKSFPDGKINYGHNDMVRDGLITEKLLYVPSHIGTDYTVFMKSEDYNKINELTELKNDLNELYNDYFYDEARNIYTFDKEEGMADRVYFCILNDIQMNFRPLWTFGINTILTHETIVNKRNKQNFKRSVIRKFMKKRSNELLLKGASFGTYKYMTNGDLPQYKIGSFLNDTRIYTIFDYGDEVTFKIPEEFYEIFYRYYEDTLTLDYLLDVLDDIDIEINEEYLLYTPILLFIVSNFIDRYLAVESENRYY